MVAESAAELKTVRDWLAVTVERFNKAGLYFGHGSANAHDEAAYLVLHTLKLPLDELDSVLRRQLTPAEIETLDGMVCRRVDERIPAAYLTREAWLGEFRFYVDERAIVPRSYIAELLRDELVPSRAAWPSCLPLLFLTPQSMRRNYPRTRWKLPCATYRIMGCRIGCISPKAICLPA